MVTISERTWIPIAVLLLWPFSMRADVIFSSLTGTYSGGGEVCGGAPTIYCGIGAGGGNSSLAAEFTATADYVMTDALVYVAAFPGDVFGGAPVSSFDVFLYSDNAGLPGSAIEQIGFALNAINSPPFPASVVAANIFQSPVMLFSGSSYWLLLQPHVSNTEVIWAINGSPASPYASFRFTPPQLPPGTLNGPFGPDLSYAYQFEIDGIPTAAAVPEPSSLMLFTSFVAAILGCAIWASCRDRIAG